MCFFRFECSAALHSSLARPNTALLFSHTTAVFQEHRESLRRLGQVVKYGQAVQLVHAGSGELLAARSVMCCYCYAQFDLWSLLFTMLLLGLLPEPVW